MKILSELSGPIKIRVGGGKDLGFDDPTMGNILDPQACAPCKSTMR